MCYNLIVKKFAFIVIIGILIFSMCLFVGCKNDDVDKPNEKHSITISFDANGIFCTVPEDLTVDVSGDCINIGLPIPSDAPVYNGYDLAWFVDSECKTLFSSVLMPLTDMTLYLGYNPKTYSITYTNKDEYDFEGEFQYSYVYGYGVALPNVDFGKGYHPGNWYYGDGEKDFFTTAISKSAMGDLVLTFKAVPIKYNITYVANLPEGEEMDNPNISVYDVTLGRINLLPATAEGKTFSHWEYRSVMQKTKQIDYIDLDLILECMSFSIWAVWEK